MGAATEHESDTAYTAIARDATVGGANSAPLCQLPARYNPSFINDPNQHERFA